MRSFILFVGILLIISSSLANVCKERSKWGNVCKSCSERVYCIQHAEEWKEIDLGTCGEGFICNDRTGMCVESKEVCYAQANSKEFQCKVEGIFPDPMDCTHFYVCFATRVGTNPKITFLPTSRQSEDETLVAMRLECPAGKTYSARTQSCSLDEATAKCIKPYCTRPGQQAVWPDDDEIFYICSPTGDGTKKELYPVMLRCAAGERFDGTRCIRAGAVAPSTINMNSSSAPIPPTTVKVPVPTTPQEEAVCKEKGLRPNPTDCNKYYYCDASLKPKSYSCPQNQIFSATLRSCVKGKC